MALWDDVDEERFDSLIALAEGSMHKEWADAMARTEWTSGIIDAESARHIRNRLVQHMHETGYNIDAMMEEASTPDAFLHEKNLLCDNIPLVMARLALFYDLLVKQRTPFPSAIQERRRRAQRRRIEAQAEVRDEPVNIGNVTPTVGYTWTTADTVTRAVTATQTAPTVAPENDYAVGGEVNGGDTRGY